MKVGRTKSDAQDPLHSKSFFQRLKCLLTSQTLDQRYLAAASDHADLERRIRDLERANCGPALVTFDH